MDHSMEYVMLLGAYGGSVPWTILEKKSLLVPRRVATFGILKRQERTQDAENATAAPAIQARLSASGGGWSSDTLCMFIHDACRLLPSNHHYWYW
jgi:hypothetical protein